jgi:acetyltransferase-like isoleucine patch superfamily enzyme
MKRKLKRFFEKHLSGFLPYQVVMGGYQYYLSRRENCHQPEQFLYYGKGVRIEAGTEIAAPERLYIGDNVGISQACQISAVGGCHIGRGCQIGGETIIFTIDHQYSAGDSLPYDSVRLVKPVFIEDYVWIGLRSIIAPGVRIGEGAIIGLGSVVFQDVPPLAIVSGNPAQILTYRNKEQFEKAKAAGMDVDCYKELPLLRVPPATKRKFRNELKDLGFDLSSGKEFFYYDKRAELSKRLVPVDESTGFKPDGMQ